MPQKTGTGKFQNPLYRSKQERILAGICGGVAEYFNIDVTLVRIIWVISIFMNGLGVIAYLATLIIVPENPNQEPIVKKEKKKNSDTTVFIIGGIIIAIGLLMLVSTHRYDFPFLWRFDWNWMFGWNLLWPVLLILIGVLWILNTMRKDEEKMSTQKGTDAKERRFIRLRSDRMIGGVCSGLARYLNIDVAFIRIGWIVLTVLTELIVGVLVYIVLLFVIPQEE